MALRLGFGKNFNLISNSERDGLIPTKKWIKDNLNNGWSLGDTLVAGIGQGYISATPIQLNVMISMIANKGSFPSPNADSDMALKVALRILISSIISEPITEKLHTTPDEGFVNCSYKLSLTFGLIFFESLRSPDL